MSRWPLLAFAPLLACPAQTSSTPTPEAVPVVTPARVADPAPTPPTSLTPPARVADPAPTPPTSLTPPAPPATEVEPAGPPPVTTPSPTGEPVVRWWCVCYSRAAASGAEKVTACRRERSECRALEGAVAAGNKGLVARSVTRPCIELEAAHPGDVHGGRDAWVPSQKAGSWMSVGACHLPGDGDFVQNDTRGHKVMEDERIGELAFNMSAAAVIARLGEPAKKGRFFVSEVAGGFYQEWSYPALGLQLGMVSERRESPQAIGEIILKAPGTSRTRLGIGIGSTRAELLAAYGKLRDPEPPFGEYDDTFVAGSSYGGVIFTLKKEKVVEIFVGADAE